MESSHFLNTLSGLKWYGDSDIHVEKFHNEMTHVLSLLGRAEYKDDMIMNILFKQSRLLSIGTFATLSVGSNWRSRGFKMPNLTSSHLSHCARTWTTGPRPLSGKGWRRTVEVVPLELWCQGPKGMLLLTSILLGPSKGPRLVTFSLCLENLFPHLIMSAQEVAMLSPQATLLLMLLQRLHPQCLRFWTVDCATLVRRYACTMSQGCLTTGAEDVIRQTSASLSATASLLSLLMS